MLKKKLVSLVLVFVFAVTSTPFAGITNVFAVNWEDVLSYEENDEGTGIIITDCDNTVSGDLVIPETIGGLPVTGVGYRAFDNCISLTSVTIPDSVTSIGDWAFAYCSSLTSITIPDGVTSIGDVTFYECSSITSVTIPDSVTSIGEQAFCYCSLLTSITIPNGVTSIGIDAFSDTAYYKDAENWQNGVLYIGKHLIEAKSDLSGNYAIKDGTLCIADSAFASCDLFTSITIPDSVTSIGDWAFSYCDLLSSITIPDSVTSIGCSAFEACSSLTSVTIGNGVTSIGEYAFYNCSSLTAINVDTGNANYSSIDGILFNKNVTELIKCPKKKSGSYTIPDSVTSICEEAFAYCSLFTSITIPDSVESIGNSAFYNCSLLTSVTIPNSVTSIGYSAFCGCTSLTNVTIPDSVTDIGYSPFYHTAYYNDAENWQNGVLYIGKHLIEAEKEISGNYTIKEGTLCIADFAFACCTSLTSITIPDSVTSIGERAFASCSSLTSVTIGNGVTSIGNYAFSECTSLKSITIPNSVTDIGEYAFGYTYDEDTYELVVIDGFLIKCGAQSAAYQYAVDNDIAYEIISLKLKPGSDFVINTNYGVVISNEAELTVAAVLAQFTNGNIVVFMGDEQLSENSPVGTGCVVQLKNGDEVLDTLTVVVQGDLDGDGKVRIDDARKALRAAVGLEIINEFQSLSADIDKNGKVQIPDVRTVLRVAVGLEAFSE